MISMISFKEIFPIWKNYLWPHRTSEITSNSAMCFCNGYDLYNMNTQSSFFGYFINDMLIGVNSGHMCKDLQYRSRGLFVFEAYRGLGIGKKLLGATINQAKLENAQMIWSYPRKTSWKTYESVGFKLVTEWQKSETSDDNAFCNKILR